MTRKASNNSITEKLTTSVKNSITNYGKKESSDSKVIGSNSTKDSDVFKYKSDPRVQLNINPTDWKGKSDETRDPKRLCYVTGMTNGMQASEYIFLSGIYKRNGIVFDLTPKIDYSQAVNYAKTDIPHFNGTLFNYKNTPSPTINLTGHFINGNINEVSYNIQVIHFLKSISLSDFGTQNRHQGLPPPFLYLNGFGITNFRNLRVIVKQFSVTYPDNVDYIKSFLNMDSLICYSYNPMDLARTTKTIHKKYLLDDQVMSIDELDVGTFEPSPDSASGLEGLFKTTKYKKTTTATNMSITSTQRVNRSSQLQKFSGEDGRSTLFKNIGNSTWNADNTKRTVEVLLPVKFDINIQLEVLPNFEEQAEFSLRKFKRGYYIKQGYKSDFKAVPGATNGEEFSEVNYTTKVEESMTTLSEKFNKDKNPIISVKQKTTDLLSNTVKKSLDLVKF